MKVEKIENIENIDLESKKCKNCNWFEKKNKYCFKYHQEITDDIMAMVCKYYKEKKKDVVNSNCKMCQYRTKYNYCLVKKKVFSEDDLKKICHCRSFQRKVNNKMGARKRKK